jgi:hypothetical protein
LVKLTFGTYFNQPFRDSLNQLTQLVELTLGYYFNAAGTTMASAGRLGMTTTGTLIINTLPVQSSYSNSDIQTNQATAQGTGLMGFALNVIR